jgi:hypothetical protein
MEEKMKQFKSILVCCVLMLSIPLCSKGNNNVIGKSEFNKMDVKDQVKYINELSRNERFFFVNNILIDSVYFYPPNAVVQFKSDGRVKVLNLFDGIRKLSIAHWKNNSGCFKIWKDEITKSPFPETKEILCYDIKAQESSEYNGKYSLGLVFLSKDGEEMIYLWKDSSTVYDELSELK